MLKVYSIFLASAILFQSFSFDLKDVSEIAVLVHHLTYHLEQGEEIDDFISQHYGNRTIEHNDVNNEHERLPFRHLHVDSQCSIVFIINKQFFLIKLNEDELLNTRFFYIERIIKLFESNFFKPPRIG